MGISDKDYADALIYEKQKQAAQQQREEARMSISGATGLGNLIGSMGGMGQAVTTSGTVSSAQTGFTINPNVNQPYGQFKVLTEKDLKNDAMKAPLSALVDMWTVRWGGEWVGEKEFQEDDFWRIALVRLTGANKLERHNLASQYASVYRIIE
jgi:hypothetical protein